MQCVDVQLCARWMSGSFVVQAPSAAEILQACKLLDVIRFVSKMTDFVHSSAARKSALFSFDTVKVFKYSAKEDMVKYWSECNDATDRDSRQKLVPESLAQQVAVLTRKLSAFFPHQRALGHLD